MQDDVFEANEGNNWFERNKDALNPGRDDVVVNIIRQCNLQPVAIAELGCSNGYRLERLRQEYNAECYGIDLSSKAIEDGMNRFPKLHLRQCGLGDLQPQKRFDLVIVNFVLHWIDRRNLLKSIANIDSCVQWGGDTCNW